MKTNSVQVMISYSNQSVEMVREAQDREERLPGIGKLSSRCVLYSKERVERVLNGDDIVGRYHDGWYRDSHVCKPKSVNILSNDRFTLSIIDIPPAQTIRSLFAPSTSADFPSVIV